MGLRHVYCDLNVDGERVLAITIRQIDDNLPTEDWKRATKQFTHASRRTVSFPGTAVIGSDGALATAVCGSPTKYVYFDVRFFGDRVEKNSQGYKKLQRFLEDFAPAITKEAKCTDR